MEKQIIKKPKIYLVCSLLILLIAILFLILFLFIVLENNKEWPILIMPIEFIISSVYFTMYSIFSKVEILGETIIITNWYGKKRKDIISNIYLGFSKKMNFVYIYKNGKRIGKVGVFDENFEIIIKKVRKK
jgi:O-antigen/teichoic acid export membrane protein